MRQAFSYSRFSDKKQAGGTSLDRQAKRFAAICAAKKWTPDLSTFSDSAVSAFRGKNARDGDLRRFITAIETGKVPAGSVLVLENIDRLSRQNPWTALTGTLKEIIDLGVAVYSEAGDLLVDRNSDAIDLIRLIVEQDRSHKESKYKSERVKQSWAKRHQLETKATSVAPAWLKLSADKTRFLPVPEKVATVKRIFDLAIAGYGIASIAKTLNREKVPSIARSGQWLPYVAKVLHNRAVLGEYLRHEMDANNKRKPAGDPIIGYYPAIITEDTFYRAQKAISDRKHKGGNIGKAVSNLFSHLVFDARDGAKMVNANKGKRSSGKALVNANAKNAQAGAKYSAINYETFEQAILAHLQEVKPRDILPQASDATDTDKILSQAQGKLAKTQVAINKTEKALLDDPSPALVSALSALGKQAQSLQTEVDRLKGMRAQDSPSSSLSQTQTLIDLLSETKPKDLESVRLRLRSAIRSVIDRILVLVEVDGDKRMALVQVCYHGGDYRSLVILQSRKYTGGGKANPSATVETKAFQVDNRKPKGWKPNPRKYQTRPYPDLRNGTAGARELLEMVAGLDVIGSRVPGIDASQQITWLRLK